MNQLYALLFIAIFAFCSHGYEISWSGNVTTNEVENLAEFKYRSSAVLSFPFLATYFSAYVESSTDGSNVDLDADAVLGVISYLSFPMSTYAYYDGSADVDVSSSASQGSSTVNTDQSAGILLSAFVRVEERDTSGNVVESYPLRRFAWTVQGDATGSSEGLHTLTIKAAKTGAALLGKNNADFDMYISWVIADTYGLYTIDGVETMTWPKNLESFVKIENYNYANPSNNLVLIIGSCSGSVSRTTSSEIGWNNVAADVVSAGDDLRIIYSTEATYNGETKTVNVEKSFEVSGSDLFEDQLTTYTAQLDAAWNGESECHKAVVSFEAGASVIKYDPGMSQGAMPSSAVSVLFSLALIALAALI